MKRIKLLHAQRLVLLAVLWFFVGQPFFASLFFTRERYSYARVEPWREWNKPTEPRELEAYAFAHALKLPDSLPKPVPFDFSRYNRWNFMKFYLEYRWKTSFSDFLLLTVMLDFDESARIMYYRKIRTDYFHHLCETEAGEYIFKTVENVEGIYQMRAMPKTYDDRSILNDIYGLEDPADLSSGNEGWIFENFVGYPARGFRFFETRLSPMATASLPSQQKWGWVLTDTADWRHPFWRFSCKNIQGQSECINKVIEPVTQIKSRYAYTWRGIRRNKDRSYGVAGGELIVLDRISGEILGVRRSFTIARPKKAFPFRLNWEFAAFCPKNIIFEGGEIVSRHDKLSYPFTFIRQVLHPVDFSHPEFFRLLPHKGE